MLGNLEQCLKSILNGPKILQMATVMSFFEASSGVMLYKSTHCLGFICVCVGKMVIDHEHLVLNCIKLSCFLFVHSEDDFDPMHLCIG